MLEASEPPGDRRKAAVADRRSPVASRRSAIGDRRSACVKFRYAYLPYHTILTYHTYLPYHTGAFSIFSYQVEPLKKLVGGRQEAVGRRQDSAAYVKFRYAYLPYLLTILTILTYHTYLPYHTGAFCYFSS